MNGTEIITFLENNAPLIKSAVSAVTGSLLTAIFLRHNTAAEEFEKIKAGHFKEVADDLLATGKMTYTEYYKANNFLNVAKKADEEYSKTPHTEKVDTYNFDWFIRFYEAVGNISNEEMQKIWARILAGEIDHPGSQSLRTIDVLKNLSQTEAQLFRKICSYCVFIGDRGFLPHYDNYLKKCNISYSEIMILDELGLMVSDGMLSLQVPVTQKPALAFINKELIITVALEKDEKQIMIVKQFPLTKVGMDLALLVGETLSDDYFIEFARNLKKPDYHICVHQIISFEEDGSVCYNVKNLINDQG